jgi:hypothetical protein
MSVLKSTYTPMSSDHLPMSQIESLQAALACLDLSLESELTLYRRQHLQAAGALALSESDHLAESSRLSETESGETPLANSGELNAPLSFFSQEDELLESGLATIPAQVDSRQNEADGQADGEADGQADSFNSAVPQEVGFADAVEEDPETLPEPYSAEAVAKPEALERFLDPSIEDYLESSEALLKHLDESEGAIAKPAKSSSPQSSGLAFKLLGGVLVIALLIGTAMSILKQFKTKPQKAPVPPSSLPQPSVSMPPKPVLASPSAIAVTPLPLKQNPISSPSLTPTVRPSAFYAVIAPYQGAESLQRARQLVPDAFIAEIDGQSRIQLAYIDDLRQAQRLVNDLKNEGFAASIVSQN